MDTQKTQAAPAQGRPFQVRSNVRAGAVNAGTVKGDCGLGLQYWKGTYQELKSLASSLGCI
jgi:hypothetical protein